MSKKTLLQMTQDILSDMNDDEVNSINDTLRSLQVAQIIESSYDVMLSMGNWKHLETLLELEGLSDTTKPTHMKLPEDIKELDSVKYNKAKATETRAKYDDIPFLENDEFLLLVNGYNTDNDDVDLITDFSGVKFPIKTKIAPTAWTSFDNVHIVFNSFDSATDSTLQSSKTQCLGFRSAPFSMVDGFTPDMPVEFFPHLIAEAKSACFARLKQEPELKSEQQAKITGNRLSRKGTNLDGAIRLPNYGRRVGRG